MKQIQRSTNTISKLIDTGYRLFAINGFASTSVNDIVQAAGYSKGAFYAHFASKEEFLIQVITERVQGYFDNLENILLTKEKNMVYLFAEYSAQLAKQAKEESFSAILFELVVTTNRYPNAKQLLIELFNEWRTALSKFIQHMQQDGLIRCKLNSLLLANTAISVFHGFLLQNYLDETVSYHGFVESFIQTLDPIEPIQLPHLD